VAEVTGVIDWLGCLCAIFHHDHATLRFPFSTVFYLFLPESVNGFLLIFLEGNFSRCFLSKAEALAFASAGFQKLIWIRILCRHISFE